MEMAVTNVLSQSGGLNTDTDLACLDEGTKWASLEVYI